MTVLKRSEVMKDNDTSRIDPEYFKKEYLGYLKILTNFGYDYAGTYADITDGIHASIDYSPESGIRLLSAQSPKENFFNLSAETYISEAQHLANQRTSLQVGDVIVSTVGTIGNCAVVDNSILPANADRHVGILRFRDTYLPYFVSTFLLTKYGRFQTLREATGNVQLNLFIYKLKSLKIPRLPLSFQIQIDNTVQSAHAKLEESKRLYAAAEAALMEALGLQGWQPPSESVAVKSFSQSFAKSGRLDAEYYQPRFQNLMNMLRQSGQTIGTVAKTAKRQFKPEAGQPFNYIEISDIGDITNIGSEILDGADAPSRAQWIVKTGDIIASTVRPIRRLSALIAPEQNNFVCSSGFAVLQPEFIEPETLLVYLRLPIICELLDLHTSASMYPAISISDLLEIPFPHISLSTRQNIVKFVSQAKTSSQESKRLLESARRAVEAAIEG